MATFQQVQVPSNVGEPTIRNLDINSSMNDNVFNIYGIDPNTGPTITTIEILNSELTELLIRFDTAPKYYQKEDYAHLVSLLYNSLKYIYKPESNKTIEFKGLATTETAPLDEITLKFPGIYLVSEEGTYSNFLDIDGHAITITEDSLIQSIIFLVPNIIDDTFSHYSTQRYRLSALTDESITGDGTSSNKYRVVISSETNNILQRESDGLSVVIIHDQTLSGNADTSPLTVRLSTQGTGKTKNILSKRADGLHAEETDPYYEADKPNIALKDGSNSAINILSFITNPIVQPLLAGQFQYDPTEGTVILGMNGGDVMQSLGLELFIRYKATETINNGDLLMYDGTDGNSGTIKLKKATVNCDPKLIYGIATEDATTGGLHFATWYGKIKDINTSMYQSGNDLYQSTSTAGALQTTQPAAPYNKASYAKVINSHHNQGTLFVRINRSFSMNDINDAQITSATNGQALVYDDGDGVWKNSSSLGINDIAPAGGELNIAGTTVVEALEADSVQSTDGFVKPLHDDTEILLAGGGTKEISDFQLMTEKGQPNGYASLDAAGLVPTTQLPAYIDDVLEFDNLAAFPVVGETGKIYVAKDTNKTYRWSGSVYIYITSGAVDSVAGKTGVVTLVKGDVGLGNVDNTSDLNKPISTATQTALNGKVNNTGNETIAGVKTFSSSPKVPLTPIANEDAASKAYADGQANAALTLAQKYAENPEDVQVVTGEYSAKHYSLKAAQSAQSINESADMLIRHESEISSIENVINSMNPNQEATATVTGVDTIALPKTAANGGMQVQLFGQSAQNLVVNGDFRNGTTKWSTTGAGTLSAASNEMSYTVVTPASTARIQHSDKILNFISGNKYYARFYAFTPVITANCRIYLGSLNPTPFVTAQANTWTLVSGIGAPTSNDELGFYIPTVDLIAGQQTKYRGAMAINLTATFGAGNEPTKEQCDLIFADFFEGSDNVLGTGRVRSVGKNLFSNVNLSSFTYDGEFYTRTLGTSNSKNFILGAGTYRLSLFGQAITPANSFAVEIKNTRNEVIKVFYPSTTLQTHSDSFIIPANGYYYLSITVGAVGGLARFKNVMIERGNIVTTYEPYRQSILQLTTPELRSNGLIKDEIRKGTNGYELVKRVGVGTLGATEIVTNSNFESGITGWSHITNGTGNLLTWDSTKQAAKLEQVVNVSYNYLRQIYNITTQIIPNRWYYFQFKIWLENFTAGSNVEVSLYESGTITEFKLAELRNQQQGVWVTYKVLHKIQTNATAARFDFRFNGVNVGAIMYVDDVSIKEATIFELATDISFASLIGTNLHYTLATPVITPIPHAGLLNSNSNGTAYFEPIIADAGVYGANLAIQLTDYPIDSFESIRKYANGTYTELNIATAVIAGDGLSFTHPDLVSGDLVMFTYAYANESIGRSMTLSYSISNSNPYYNVTNSVPLTTGFYTSTTARLAVPEGVRKTGLILTYETAAGVWYTERYIGTATDTTSFTTASNWEIGVLRIASVTDTTEYAEITI